MAFVLSRRPDRTGRQASDRAMGIDVSDSSRPVLITETVINVQSKSLDITAILGAGKVLQIDSIRWELLTEPTPGTRQMAIEITDGGDVIWKTMFDSGTDMSQTQNEAISMISGGNAFVAGLAPAGPGPHRVPLPPNLFVGSGQILRMFIVNGKAGDDLTLHIKGREV